MKGETRGGPINFRSDSARDARQTRPSVEMHAHGGPRSTRLRRKTRICGERAGARKKTGWRRNSSLPRPTALWRRVSPQGEVKWLVRLH